MMKNNISVIASLKASFVSISLSQIFSQHHCMIDQVKVNLHVKDAMHIHTVPFIIYFTTFMCIHSTIIFPVYYNLM